MKKAIILFTGSLFLTTACYKEYACHCKNTDGSEYFSKSLKATSKKKANEACGADVPDCYTK